MDNEYEQKLRKQFNRVAPYLNDSDTDHFTLADWIVDFRNFKNKNCLSETFIREFAPFLTPSDISTPATVINKDFIREWNKKVYIAADCFKYKVNDDFIKEFALPTTNINNLPPLDQPFAKDYEETFWRIIVYHQNMSKNIIRRFKLMIKWEELNFNSRYGVPAYNYKFYENYKTYTSVCLENVR